MSASRNGAFPKIVAAVDGSASSMVALRWAIGQAELTDGSVEAVIAWQYPHATGGLGWTAIPISGDADYEELAAKTLAEAVAHISPPPAVPVHETVVEGNPAQVIIAAANDADMLVVGKRGHGSFTDALIGSVSINCLHHATCPVVVVHGPREH